MCFHPIWITETEPRLYLSLFKLRGSPDEKAINSARNNLIVAVQALKSSAAFLRFSSSVSDGDQKSEKQTIERKSLFFLHPCSAFPSGAILAAAVYYFPGLFCL